MLLQVSRLFPASSVGEAQRWHAEKQLLTLVTLLLLTGLAIATRHFVASGIGKKNYEMVLHERGSTGACLCNIQR